MNEERRKLLFVAHKGRRPIAQTIDLEGTAVARPPQFLSENLMISPASGKGARYLFIFPRSNAAEVDQIVSYLRDQTSDGILSKLESRFAEQIAPVS
jgi:hypothetical protein